MHQERWKILGALAALGCGAAREMPDAEASAAGGVAKSAASAVPAGAVAQDSAGRSASATSPVAGMAAPPAMSMAAPPAMSGAAMTLPAAAPAAASGEPPRLQADYYAEAWSPAAIPIACQGFALEGLRFSPGGSLLPNRCEPFDATTNNPFAVRCVDAWAGFNSGFPGDSACILPPAPELGIQIGAHPQALQWYEQVASGDLSGYARPADEWVMQSGEEETLSYRTSSSNKQSENYYRIYYRMRPGSHHTGISANDDPSSAREVWLPGSTIPTQLDPTLGSLISSIGAVQRPDDGTPETFDQPPEDAGLYSVFPAGAAILMNMHHFNFQPEPLLKEVWVNVFWASDTRFKIDALASIPVEQALALAVPAGTTVDLHYFWSISEPLRVLRLYAHRHAWTPSFSAWVERKDVAAPELVYQSFDWFDVPTYRYDSLRQNPAPNPKGQMDGAHSGVLELQAGDKLHFNCHITFTDARAAQVGLPQTATQIGTLRFANEAYTAEMCALLGSSAKGPKLSTSPEWGEGSLPDFATLD